ncbi:MAG: hypothetical protein IJZ77_04155, partial [Bacilli bacterium]|nr:hypothetical protein [Bacilli bacterium]
MQNKNANAKGERNHQGEIAEYFKKMRSTIERNDGTRSFEWITDTCHDQQAPFDHNKETRIALTSTQHDISDFSKGFFTLKVTVKDVMIAGLGNIDDPYHLLKGILCWRDSNSAFRQIQLWVNGHSTGYNQQEGIREGFAYSSTKGEEEMTQRFIHTLYEKAVSYSPQICGSYFNFSDFVGNQTRDLEWDVNVPFDDLLLLQAFDLFPNFAIPNVELRVILDPAGLVWCPVNPQAVYDTKTFLEEEEIPFTLPHLNYTHHFTQVNNSATAITNFSVDESNNVTASSGEVTLICNRLRVNDFSSHMAGFGICEQSKQEIMQELAKGIDVPAQYLTFDSFPDAANVNGIQTSLRATLSNVANLSVVFPRHANDITVMQNPMYQNLQLRIDNKNYPDRALSTLGAEFLQMQVIASDLDGPIQCTQEFEDAYTQTKNDATNGKRYANTLRDDTRFIWNVQLERNGGG